MVQGKGSAFEREICVKLSGWVSNGTRNDVFWRTAMSGGRASVFKKKGTFLRQSGDITAVAIEGHKLTDEFYFELKFYKDLNFPAFFVKGGGILGQFWNTTQEEAKAFGLKPVLIVKQNRMPVLWVCRFSEMPKHWTISTKAFRVQIHHLGCMIYRFDDVVRSVYEKPTVERIK